MEKKKYAITEYKICVRTSSKNDGSIDLKIDI